MLRSAKVKSQDNISNSESSAKNILNEASTKSAEIIRLANLERESSKDKGLKEAETLLSKDISRILTQISEKAFSGKVSADVNSDFVSNVFKETYSK